MSENLAAGEAAAGELGDAASLGGGGPCKVVPALNAEWG